MAKRKFLKKVVIAVSVSTALLIPVSGGNIGIGSAVSGITTCYAEEDEIVSGLCGKNVIYTLNKTTGNLVISGSGKIYDDPSFNNTQTMEYIKNVIIDEGVTGIGNLAFYLCSNLTSITLPKGLTTIGNSAFSGCSNLTSIILPEGLISIGESAFFGCDSLKSITLPEGLTSMGDLAFANCGSLNSITFPKSLTSTGAWVLANCSSLTSITLSEGLTSIERAAFYDCSSLSSITIPEGVTGIGEEAFSGCSSLSSITLPKGLTSTGTGAFRDCSGLSSIILPEGLTAIDAYAFSGCSSLSSMALPESLTSIGDAAFDGCSSLSDITIPEGVTWIGPTAFSGCSSLSSITIPEGVTEIYGYAFSGCSSLSSIALPERLTSIWGNAFSGCSSLSSITIPEGVTSIGQDAFKDCVGLTIYGHAGSYAEKYADSESMKFVDPLLQCTVKFYNGELFEEQTVQYGESATAPAITRSPCYTLSWDKAFDQVTEDLEVYAVWTEAHQWDSEWTIDQEPTETEEGSKSHHCLECGEQTDITVIPKLEPVKFTVKFYNGDKLEEEQTVLYGESATAPALTASPCYTLSWDKAFDQVAENLEVYAIWTETHQWDSEWTIDQEPTTTEEGSKSHHCTVCEERTDITVIPKKASFTGMITEENGAKYWYENGIKQGTEGRGKEIYDPETDAWYWLDAIDGGKVATGKDVYQESNGGKWVRYDENGRMIKGWDITQAGQYYFDLITGAMTKGAAEVGSTGYSFDNITGILLGKADKIFITKDGNRYWYEDGIRQGTEGRGKEIYDPETDAWYWLDAVDNGKVATSKDVYQESWAGQYADNEDGTGKWVRYDKNGYMIKGWSEQNGNRYYFDLVTGAMAKGDTEIGGVAYHFDQNTGVLQQEREDEDRIDHDELNKPNQDEEADNHPKDDDVDEPNEDEEVSDNPEQDDADEPNEDEEVSDNPKDDVVDEPNQDEEVNDNPEQDDADQPDDDENASEEHPDPDGPGWSNWVK